MNNKLQIVKTAVSTVIGVGTGKIVASIIQNNTNPVTITDKVTIAASSFALGSMVAEITARYTDAKIDRLAAFVEENLQK